MDLDCPKCGFDCYKYFLEHIGEIRQFYNMDKDAVYVFNCPNCKEAIAMNITYLYNSITNSLK